MEGLRYLVMELADRGSLDTRIEKQVRVDELAVLTSASKSPARSTWRSSTTSFTRHQAGNILFDYDNEPKLWIRLARNVEAEQDFPPSRKARLITSRRKKSSVSRKRSCPTCIPRRDALPCADRACSV